MARGRGVAVVVVKFCSFKAKLADSRNFCRNSDNVTGLCDRRSCPLANSRYATIKEENGRAVLYVKTAERAHTPKKLWEKTVLPRNYADALAKVDAELAFWPQFLLHKNKQRLTKIHQMLIRMRKLRREGETLMEAISQKDERRERTREAKALKAAQLERSIEEELLQRLKQGTYGDIYNYPSAAYERALKEADAQYEEEREESGEELQEDGLDEQRTEFFEGDLSESDDDEAVGDVEDFWQEPALPPPAKPAAGKLGKRRTEDTAAAAPSALPSSRSSSKKPRRGPYVEIEYETEPGEKALAHW